MKIHEEITKDIEEGIQNPDTNPLRLLSKKYPYYVDGKPTNIRYHLTSKFAWAIPDDETLKALANLKRDIVEIGAGTGYWARLLSNRNVNIVVYDICPVDACVDSKGLYRGSKYRNEFFDTDHSFFNVQHGDFNSVCLHPDRALLLCWPPYKSSLALDTSYAYGGDMLIFIGETQNGCTSNAEFWEYLEDNWSIRSRWMIPTFHGFSDCLSIYRRK